MNEPNLKNIPPWQLVSGHLLLISLCILGILIIPDDIRRDWHGYQLLCAPSLLTLIAGVLMQRGLRNSQEKLGGWRVKVGLLPLVLACIDLGVFAHMNQLATGIALLLALPVAVIAVGLALWQAWSLPSWRKLSALLIGVLFPVALYGSIQLGGANAPPAPTPKEIALRQTGRALKAARNNPTGPLPDSVVESCGWIYESCWKVLQEAAIEGSNQYTMTVVAYNKEDGNFTRGGDEILVDVVFSNNRRMLVYTYDGFINGCIWQSKKLENHLHPTDSN